MIYATGDTHREFCRFEPQNFPEQKQMSREDYVLILGDFGAVWDGHRQDRQKLDWLEALPYTTLFIDGNHENFDLLQKYPVEEWHGGKVHFVRPHVIHLMRGQCFEIDGRTFCTMGGASSHDMPGGVLNPHSLDYEEMAFALKQSGIRYRVDHRTWWRQELPSAGEYEEARRTMKRIGWKSDYILTHCAPSSISDLLSDGTYAHDTLTDFLENEVRAKMHYRHWLFGHYHIDENLPGGFTVLSEQIVRLP